MDTVNIFIRIPPEELVFLCGIIESHDDLAVVKTLDSNAGLAVIMTSPGFKDSLISLLQSIADDTRLEILQQEEKWAALFREKIYGMV